MPAPNARHHVGLGHGRALRRAEAAIALAVRRAAKDLPGG
jgi:hypothetical protein